MREGQLPTQDSLTSQSSMKAGKDRAREVDGVASFDDIFSRIGPGLYTLASMLVGEGEQSLNLVEKAVASAEVSSHDDAAQALKYSQWALCREAIGFLDRRRPGCLDAPEALAHETTCIEDDDLDAAGVSRDELTRMFAGPDRDRLRIWLASLPDTLRVIFVLRAVAGHTSAETASLLSGNRGPMASPWSAEAVREVFRQALCSLTSQLIHAAVAR
jgi:DNA-directed RNA polymerase specialized sigma24 family protein